MATPQSTISFSDINTELELPFNNIFGLGDQQPRNLCGILTGAISMNDLKNKRYKSSQERIGEFITTVGDTNIFDIRDSVFKNEFSIITHVMYDDRRLFSYLYLYFLDLRLEGKNIWHTLPKEWKITDDTRIRSGIGSFFSYYDGFKFYPDGVGR